MGIRQFFSFKITATMIHSRYQQPWAQSIWRCRCRPPPYLHTSISVHFVQTFSQKFMILPTFFSKNQFFQFFTLFWETPDQWFYQGYQYQILVDIFFAPETPLSAARVDPIMEKTKYYLQIWDLLQGRLLVDCCGLLFSKLYIKLIDVQQTPTKRHITYMSELDIFSSGKH